MLDLVYHGGLERGIGEKGSSTWCRGFGWFGEETMMTDPGWLLLSFINFLKNDDNTHIY